jgi:hypothetical protein
VSTLDLPSRERIARNARDTIVERFEMKRSVVNILGMLEIATVYDRGSSASPA